MREVTKQSIANIANELDQIHARLRDIAEDIGDACAADTEADDAHPIVDRASSALGGIVMALNKATKVEATK